MFEYILGGIIALAILFNYFCIVKPKKQIEFYRKMFEQEGYKVKIWPFKPMGVATLSIVFGDSQKGDAFSTYKKVFPEYDVSIGNYLNKPLIQFLNPELRNQFGKAERNFYYNKLPELTRLLKRAIGAGVVLSEGETWKKKRKIMSDLFTYDLIKNNYNKIAQLCDDALLEFEKGSEKSEGVYEYDVLQMTSYLFSMITSEFFIGGNCSKELIKGERIGSFFINLINDVNIQAKNPLAIIFGPKLLNLGLTKYARDINERISLIDAWGNAEVDKRMKEEMERVKREGEKYESKDVISVYIKMKTQGKDTEVEFDSFSKNQIFEEFKLFFLAGTDTTGHFTQMMLYYIAKNPEVQRKLREQVEKYCSEEDYSPEIMKKLRYIDSIQKETTRMYGPTNFILPRRVIQDHFVKKIPIKKGVITQFYSVGTHFSEKLYPEPHRFNPDRWMDLPDNSELSNLLTGFGIGARSCPGKNMAMFETKIALIKIVKRYKNIQVDGEIGLRWKFLYVPDDFKIRLTLDERVKK